MKREYFEGEARDLLFFSILHMKSIAKSCIGVVANDAGVQTRFLHTLRLMELYQSS